MKSRKVVLSLLLVAIILLASCNATTKDKPSAAADCPKPQLYDYAIYEQVFPIDFVLDKGKLADDFNVVWSKEELDTVVIDQDSMDTNSALVVKNTTAKPQKLTITFDEFLKKKDIDSKDINFKFYARTLEGEKGLDVSLQADSVSENYIEALTETWQRFENIKISMPDKARHMKLIINVKPGQVFKMDGLIIVEKS